MLTKRQFPGGDGDKHLNIPIQMIECVDTTGQVHPMRFRFFDEDQQLVTVQAGDIVSYKSTGLSITITLYAEIYDRRRLIDIMYGKSDGFWRIMCIRS